MITPDTMSIEAREVRLEVYLNGAFHSDDTYFALDDKDVQLEFEITDAIYDLLGCSASQDVDVKLKVVTDDQVSITYCSPGEMRLQLEVDGNEDISVCEVKDLQLKMNRNDSISELKSPKDLSDPAGASGQEANDQGGLDAEENRPAECTAGRMTKNSSTVFQRFRAGFQRKMPNSDGQPEVDLIDPEEFCVSDPSAPEPEPEVDLVDNKQSCIIETDLFAPPEAKLDLVDPEESCVSPKENIIVMKIKKVHGFVMTKRTEYATVRNIKKIRTFLQNDPEWDLAAPEESCEPAPSAPEPESKVVSALTRLKNYIPLNVFQLEDCLKKCTPLKQRHVTKVWPRIFIGDGLPTAYRHCSEINEYLMPAAKFIDKALDKRASKVLICCKQGVEHSATLFLAYPMIYHDMMVEEAIDHVM